jgi:hypothetical protein
MKNQRIKWPVAAAAVLVQVWAANSAARAGGTFINTVQDGDWSSVSTWDIRVPDASMGDQARISHVVAVTSAGQNTNVLHVGWSAGPGILNVSAGDLAVNAHFIVGDDGELGTFTNSGADVSADNLRVGWMGPGAFTMSGGSLSVTNFTDVGTEGFDATLTVEGASPTISANDLSVGADATLVIRPTGNGSAGLSAIGSNGNVTVDPGSTLELDASLYTPAAGDEWDVIATGGTINGTFDTLTAPAGLLIEQEVSGGVLTIRVVGTIPTVSTWGLSAMVLALAIGGTMAIGRRTKTA